MIVLAIAFSALYAALALAYFGPRGIVERGFSLALPLSALALLLLALA